MDGGISDGIISDDIIPCPSDMFPPGDAHDLPEKLSSLWSDTNQRWYNI